MKSSARRAALPSGRRSRRSTAARLALVAALAMASADLGALRAAVAQALVVPDLLDAYARGEFDRVQVRLGGATDYARLQRDLERTVRAWPASSLEALERRRTTAAALALEAARASYPTDRDAARALIEWGCALLRQQSSTATPTEGAWQPAALALMQGFHDRPLLVEHLRHTEPRFSSDPHVGLARAWVLEAGTWLIASRRPDARDVEEMKMRTARVQMQRYSFDPADYRVARMWELADLLERLASAQEVAVDARLRLGHTLYRLGQYERALEELRQVEGLTTEAFVRFIARLLTGRVLETLDEREQAIAAYRHTLAIEPAAQSAAFALAGLLFVADRRAEAAEIAGRALAEDRTRDPWRRYHTGTFYRWPQLIETLRRHIHE
jgi:tetratricopeptide (TPR) repeat protein